MLTQYEKHGELDTSYKQLESQLLHDWQADNGWQVCPEPSLHMLCVCIHLLDGLRVDTSTTD